MSIVYKVLKLNISKLLACKSHFLSFLLFPTLLGSCYSSGELKYQQVVQYQPLAKSDNLGVIPRESWTLENPNVFDMDPMSKIYRLTIHHTAMVDESSAYSVMKLRLLKILSIHKHKNNWADIGYHYLIDSEGRIWEGRKIKYQGAHAQGKNNIGNIGISLFGNFEIDYPTEKQKQVLIKFVKELQNKYKIENRNIYGHTFFTGTKCPGKNLLPLVNALQAGEL